MDLREFIRGNCRRKSGGGSNPNVNNIGWWQSRGWLDWRDQIISFTSHLAESAPWVERFYCIENGITQTPRCPCGNPVNYSRTKHYLTYCSRKCSAKYTYDTRIRTNIERHGFPNPFQSEAVKAKSAKTCMERYGVPNAAQSDEVKARINQTFADRYVGGHPQSDPTVRSQVVATCLDRYGATSPLESAEIKQKITDSMLTRYGVTHALQSEEFRAKQVATSISRYGRPNFNQRHLTQEQLDMRSRISEITDYSVLGLSPKHVYKVLNNHGITFQTYKSLGELNIKSFIEQLVGRELKSGYRLGRTELDIYDPVTQIAIEFNGVYWHSTAKGKGPDFHIGKTRLAQSHGIRLIHVMSTEWETQQDIVKSRLTNIFGKSTRLDARQCTVSEIDADTAAQFFETTHLSGNTTCDKVYGLHHNDQLAMAMGVVNTDSGLSIARHSTHLNHTVVDGLAILIASCKKDCPGALTAECDLRWDSGHTYESLGFTLVKTNEPVLRTYPDGTTNAHDVWDCGSLVFSLSVHRDTTFSSQFDHTGVWILDGLY